MKGAVERIPGQEKSYWGGPEKTATKGSKKRVEGKEKVPQTPRGDNPKMVSRNMVAKWVGGRKD